jgi:small subunit ribosomal protein S20
MANTKSAEKRNRQNEQRNVRNRALKSRLRTAVKKVRVAVAAGDQKAAETVLAETLKVVDKTAQKNAVHKNAAARTKSRLSKAVAAISKSA